MLSGLAGRIPTPQDGTSFSAPYVAGVASLMVKANPSITPDQIEKILITSTVGIAADRAGAGVLDPVAAVRAAAEGVR
jgi:subtilisin family serine protease